MNIRKSIVYSLLAIFVGVSCTSHFDSLNKDPKKTKDIDINLLLPTATIVYRNAFTGYSGNMLFQSMWIQALASTSNAANYYSNGDKYVISNNTNAYLENVWNSVYPGISACKQIERLIKEKGEKTGYENLSAASGIIKVFYTSLLSDTYGDVPYSEAGLAIEGNSQPKYDKQQELYLKLLGDLEKAINGLSDRGGTLTNDILYGGKIANWKKFGYSVMLHIAMRLTKISPAVAKQWSEKAIKGGVFTSNDDSAIIKSDLGKDYPNNTANVLLVEADFYEVRWSKTFIDYMKSNNDPRLPFISEVSPDGLKANKNQDLKGDTTASKQQGLPNGYDLGAQKNITTEPNYPGPTGTGDNSTSIGKYSRPTAIYRDRNGSTFVLTYPEIKLLLAEAAVRGYSGAGDASQNYKEGTEAGMKILSLYGDKSVNISQGAIDTYTSAHPLDTSSPEASMKLINDQYWATNSTLMNFYEAWNNWRRSGYPNLTPINFSGNFSGGQIPRRQLYPTDEKSLNGSNYDSAVKAMGGDTWATRVWWDKK